LKIGRWDAHFSYTESIILSVRYGESTSSGVFRMVLLNSDPWDRTASWSKVCGFESQQQKQDSGWLGHAPLTMYDNPHRIIDSNVRISDVEFIRKLKPMAGILESGEDSGQFDHLSGGIVWTNTYLAVSFWRHTITGHHFWYREPTEVEWYALTVQRRPELFPPSHRNDQNRTTVVCPWSEYDQPKIR